MPVKMTREIPVYVLTSGSLAPFRADYEHFRLVASADWADFVRKLDSAGPDSLALIDPYGDDPSMPAPKLFRLLDGFPSVAVVAGFHLTPERVADARTMIEAGVSGIVNLRIDTTPALAARHFRDAVGRPFKRRVEAILPPYLPVDARTILRAACGVAVLGGGAQDLADVFDVSQKTLANWCEDQRLPTTRSLQLWMRLLLAAFLLEDAGRTVHSAALAAGYSSDRSLRRAFESELGIDASSLRREGAFDRVSAAFTEILRSRRAGAS